MKVKVLGKVTGTSKTNGKEWRAVTYLAPIFKGEGEETQRIFLDDEMFASVAIGKTYDVEFSPRGFLTKFEQV